MYMADQLKNESKGDHLEFHICQTASNIGIMWIRSTPGSQRMTQKWLDVIEKDSKKWDQVAFNDLKTEGGSCGTETRMFFRFRCLSLPSFAAGQSE